MRLSYLPSEFQEALPILEKIKAADLRLTLLEDLFVMFFSIVPSMTWTLHRLLTLRKLSRSSSVQ